MLLAEIQVTIARVKKMEQYLDEVLAELGECDSKRISREAMRLETREKLAVLEAYYDSGLWLHDYECDECHELPTNLKRGVLAQDTLYNLFEVCC